MGIRGEATTPKVVAYLKGIDLSPTGGKILYLSEIVKGTGLTRSQVMAVIYNLRQKGWRLEVDVPGATYKYSGEPKVSDTELNALHERLQTKPLVGQIYEAVGQDHEGNPIVRGEDGILYRIEGL